MPLDGECKDRNSADFVTFRNSVAAPSRIEAIVARQEPSGGLLRRFARAAIFCETLAAMRNLYHALRLLSLAATLVTTLQASQVKAEKGDLQRGRAWLIAGISTLGTGYLASAMTGAFALSLDTDCSGDCNGRAQDSASGLLFVPVAGPFLATGVNPDFAAFAAPMGALQVVGLGFTIAGIVVRRRAKTERQERLTSTTPRTRWLRLAAGVGVDRRGANFRLQF